MPAISGKVDAPSSQPLPQLALGLVLDTPHKRIGAGAITTMKPLDALGFPTAFAVVGGHTVGDGCSQWPLVARWKVPATTPAFGRRSEQQRVPAGRSR
ncbi:hypothetical protein ACOZ38_26470 [Sphaerisporangium viridialbum]|uniref:hypothetical protein n=1 Tax=Sphaerisporangium viridialbum TaxID=46189 RepID=UPI003C72F8EC